MAQEEGDESNGEQELDAFISRIRSGDESAARDLLARYEPQVRLVVRRQLPRLLRSRFDSIDFLQSVWGSFFRQIQSAPAGFEEPRTLVAFLARIARNKVIDKYRKASSKKGDMSLEEPLSTEHPASRSLISAEDSPSAIIEASETLARLQNLLPEDRRIVVGLRVQGLSSSEIGRQLNLSERTVRRILEDLRRRADEWEGTNQ